MNNAICSNMDRPRESERDKYHSKYMWNLIYNTNEPIYRTKQTHRHGKLTYRY